VFEIGGGGSSSTGFSDDFGGGGAEIEIEIFDSISDDFGMIRDETMEDEELLLVELLLPPIDTPLA
jgi:hypothetical protein